MRIPLAWLLSLTLSAGILLGAGLSHAAVGWQAAPHALDEDDAGTPHKWVDDAAQDGGMYCYTCGCWRSSEMCAPKPCPGDVGAEHGALQNLENMLAEVRSQREDLAEQAYRARLLLRQARELGLLASNPMLDQNAAAWLQEAIDGGVPPFTWSNP